MWLGGGVAARSDVGGDRRLVREREVEIEREEKERFIERERYVRGERNKIKN